jgi:uncharacterized protein
LEYHVSFSSDCIGVFKMRLCLKSLVHHVGSQTVVLQLEKRLPDRLRAPCEVTCVFQAEAFSDYCLLTLTVSGEFTLTCQRCLGVFKQDYLNQTNLAVCVTDATANTLMADFECIVAVDNHIDLIEIVTDELNLWLPEKHSDVAACDDDIRAFIRD